MRIRFSCLAIALAATTLSAAAAESNPPAAAIAAEEIVFDHSQVEWSETYLQWIASFARDNSPVADTTGAQCGAKQGGDVWFLAASDGTAPVVRDCAIPAGKTLFVPIVSTMERSGNREPKCESMAHIAAGTLARASGLSLTVDGQAITDLESHRLATGDCFALGARQTPRVMLKAAVADGYYVMLQPLAPGAHTLVVGARFEGTSLSTTYRLDVH